MFKVWGRNLLIVLAVGVGAALAAPTPGATPGATPGQGPGGRSVDVRRVPKRAGAGTGGAGQHGGSAAGGGGKAFGGPKDGKRGGGTPWKMAIATRQWRSALPGLRASIAANPDDANLQAYLGIVDARIGRYGEAVADFELAVGSDIYEQQGLERHADALRYTGHPQEAFELRKSAWLMTRTVNDAATMVVGMVDDLRFAGDLQAAEDWAWYLIGEVPQMEEAYAVAADVALDAGDLDEADQLLWMADLYGHRVARTRAARARMEMAHGDLKAAYEDVRFGRMRNRNHLPWAIQAETMRRQGYVIEALALLDSGHLPDKDRPDMMAARLAALASAGDLDEARALRRTALWTYPTHPDILAASKVLDLAEARAASGGE